MSRIGKKPVPVPGSVKIAIEGRQIQVEGPKGKLTYEHRPEVEVAIEDGQVTVQGKNDHRDTRAYWGLTRSLVKNMIEGVQNGYEKRLEVHGVGYLAALSGNTLQLRVGFANEIHKKIPDDVTVTCPTQTSILVQGCDKQRVGQFAAEVRAVRKPEPYKGKGIRYAGEQVKIKPGKSAQ